MTRRPAPSRSQPAEEELDVGAVLQVVSRTLQPGLSQQVLDSLASTATRQSLSVEIPMSPDVFVTAQRGLNIISIADMALPWCFLAAASAGIVLAPQRLSTIAILTAGIFLSCGALAIVLEVRAGSLAAGGDLASQTIARAFARCLVAPAVRASLEVGTIAGAFAVILAGLSIRRSRHARTLGHL